MIEISTERLLFDPSICIDRAGKGELLIFLHGIGGNRTNWRTQLEHFGKDFHVVALDARGYGDSDDYEGPLEFSDFARDLAGVLEHLGAEKAHLCGLSMGGRIAQDFYAIYPDRVASLILVSTVSGHRNYSLEERERFVQLRLKPLAEEGKMPSDIAPVIAKTLVGPEITDAQFEQIVASMSVLHKESYMKTVRATQGYDRSAELDDIHVPTLLVYGGGDRLATPAIGRTLHSRIKDSEFVEIAGAGHLINIEKPTEFDEALLKFLIRHKGRASII
jgi:3-oxoadipate enol-lactonase